VAAPVASRGAAREISAGSLASRTLKPAKKMTSAVTIPGRLVSSTVRMAMATAMAATAARNTARSWVATGPITAGSMSTTPAPTVVR
jgi:hypothetical protein